MRRFLLTNLILVFALQSSGAAVAAQPIDGSRGRSFSAELTLAAAQLLNAAKATQIGALLMGSGDRYNAMHAAPPKRPLTIKSDPTAVMHHGLIRPTHRGEGIRGTPPAMLNRPLLPKDAAKLHLPATFTGGIKSASAVHAPAIDLIGALPTIPAPRPTRPSKGIHPLDVKPGTPDTTGINPWWTYEEGSLPGVGKYMVNIANGNVIVQATDVDIPERGIDLAFRRTYNSMSQNDWNAGGGNDDGSPSPGVYGTGWTNTFDAHVSYNSAGGITVLDIDGARYDYTPNGTGCLTPPAGMYNTLCTDGGSGWLWTKKNGTVYYFFGPSNAGGPSGGYAGRLCEILGRNHNNYVIFYYSWVNGDASSSANLTQIVAQHSDGQALTLAFGTINGKVLLSGITRPDGQQIEYLYPNPAGNNNYGNLEEVDRPGNNQGTLKEQYGYYASNGVMNWVASPQWFMTSEVYGAYTWFNYDASTRTSGVQLFGYSNFVPNDGTGTAIQPGYSTGYQQIAYTGFTYSGGLTQMSDVDGHATNWYFDGLGRVTQTQEWTGALWLVTGASWDANNNLTETVDARGYATDYAYDSNGNAIAVALPSVSTSQGTFRPTSLYSYDRTNGANNIVAYCDPVRSNTLGQDWTGNPGTSDSLCPNSSGATRYVWSYGDGAEPFGFLTDSYTPLGYHVAYQYNSGGQGGDFGLPTDVIGDCAAQNDGSNECPHQTFGYDGNGNLTTYNKGYGAWSLSYDSLNRMTSATDPDSANYVSHRYYYADGSIQKTETPYQHGTGTGPTFTYDDDGNLYTEVSYHGGSYVNGGSPTLPAAATTYKYYDGADRLVEVQQPHDATYDSYTNAWITRYLYDLSQAGSAGSQPSFGSQSFRAYGNLFKTQELVPSSDVVTLTSGSPNQSSNTTPRDIKGYAFDALDRTITNYSYVLQSGTDTVSTATTTYDSATAYSSNNAGEVASYCNALNQCSYDTYDNSGALNGVTYSSSADQNKTMQFDPNGRIASINAPAFGTQSYSYDADGRETQSVEPSGGGVTSPATLTYHFYANGQRSGLDVSSSALSQGPLLAYSYRNDGKLQTLLIGGDTSVNFTYSAAGRLQQRSESGTRANGTPIQLHYDPNYGYLTEQDFPAGSELGLEYDPSGSLLGEIATNSLYSSGTTQTNGYTARGELAATTNLYGGNIVRMANGVSLNWPRLSYGQTGSVSLDPRMGVLVGNSAGNSTCTTTLGTAFDIVGRLTDENINQDGTGNTCGRGDQDSQHTYDQNNHVVTSQYTDSVGNISSANTDWGPNGHPIRIGETASSTTPGGTLGYMAYETLHWDGDQLLFTTNAAGQLDDIKVGDIADITPRDSGYAGMTFWDRDPSGSVVYCHNATGAAGRGLTNPNMQSGVLGSLDTSPCKLWGSQSMTVPTSIIWFSDKPDSTNRIGWYGVLGMPRGDGFTNGFDTIQGTRSYDSNIGAWTTPDAYQGQVHDPISQKSYVWNGSNPVMYSDPTGYLLEYDSLAQSAIVTIIRTDELPDDGQTTGPGDSQSPYQQGNDCGGLAMCFPPADPQTANRIRQTQAAADALGKGAVFAGSVIGGEAVMAVKGVGVFYTGGPEAAALARSYAEKIGAKTIEMTSYGKVLEAAGGALRSRYGAEAARRIMNPLWRVASGVFAASVREAHVFVGPVVKVNNTLQDIELPILRFFGSTIYYP